MIDVLKDVKTIVTHANCADGVASALILKDALPDARVVFVQYNTREWRDLPIEPGMLFCDMTPPPEHVQGFVDAGAVVLDHHKGAEELVAQFGGRGVYADEEKEPGVSGALLAFWEVWVPIQAPDEPEFDWRHDFAFLAGVRDTWQRSSPQWTEACAQAAALRFWPWDELLIHFGFDETFFSMMRIGPILLQKEADKVQRSIREAYRFSVEGLRVVAFEGLNTSDVAEAIDGEADLVIGWHYTHENGEPEMVVSCRSRGHLLTALQVAKCYRGGGHEKAAGFKVKLAMLPSDDPYAVVLRLVENAYEAVDG